MDCDSLVIGHEVFIGGGLIIQPLYLHILPQGSLSTVGNFTISNAMLVLNDGMMTADRVLLYPCGRFENNGIVIAIDLHIDGDTLLNSGTIYLADSLLGWPYTDLGNYGDLEAQHLFGFLNHYNFGTQHLNTVYCLGGYVNYNAAHIDNIMQGAVLVWNGVGGSMLVDSLRIDYSVENEGTIECRSFVHGYGLSEEQSQIYSGGMVITEDFYNGPMGSLIGGGDICIGGHSENHGNLGFPLGVCDASPTTTQAPYLDINTGTFGLWVGECGNTICGTLGIADGQADQPVLIQPNPSNGWFTVTVDEAIERIDVMDMQGRCVQSQVAKGMHEQRMDSSRLPVGLYVVRVRCSSGVVRTGAFVID